MKDYIIGNIFFFLHVKCNARLNTTAQCVYIRENQRKYTEYFEHTLEDIGQNALKHGCLVWYSNLNKDLKNIICHISCPVYGIDA